MPTYILLTRLSPVAVKSHKDFELLEKEVCSKIKQECKEVRWLLSYVLLEPYDYLDLFEAPDPTTAAKVKMIVRSFGHTTDTWPAAPWSRFRELVHEAGREETALNPISAGNTPSESQAARSPSKEGWMGSLIPT